MALKNVGLRRRRAKAGHEVLLELNGHAPLHRILMHRQEQRLQAWLCRLHLDAALAGFGACLVVPVGVCVKEHGAHVVVCIT